MQHVYISATAIFAKLENDPTIAYSYIMLCLVVLLIFGSPCLIGEDGLLWKIEFRIKDWYLKKTYDKKWGLGKYQKEEKEEIRPMGIERFSAKKEGLSSTSKEQKDKDALYQSISRDVTEYEADNHGIPLYDHNAPVFNPVINQMREENKAAPAPKEKPNSDGYHTVHKAVMLDLTPEETIGPEGDSSSVEPVELRVEEPEEKPKTPEVEVSKFKDFEGEIVTGQKWVTTDESKGKQTKAIANEIQIAERLISLITEASKALPDSNFPRRMMGVLRELAPEFIDRFPDTLTHRQADLVRLWEMGCNADIESLAKELDVDEATVVRVLRAHYELRGK